MEALEELKAIRDNAPMGTDLVDIDADGDISYMYHSDDQQEGQRILDSRNGEDAAIEYSDGNIRSLSDIERIIELMEQINEIEPSKEECKHPMTTSSYDYVTCDSCNMIRTDYGWGCASRKWFDNIESAKFYKKNGFLPK